MAPADGIGVATCLIEMRFDAVEADAAVQLLLTVVERIEAKTGCQSCSASRDAVDPTRIRYSEIWNSEAPFRTHVRSEEFRHVLVAMDMGREKPEVTIGSLEGRTGLEYLRELLDGTRPDPGPDFRQE